MRSKVMVALGRVVLSKRERVIMLQPLGQGDSVVEGRKPSQKNRDCKFQANDENAARLSTINGCNFCKLSVRRDVATRRKRAIAAGFVSLP